jgi:hypothetical protein
MDTIIDVKTSSGTVTFSMEKGCKNKNYSEGNAAMAWERLKNKYEPTSAPSLVKAERLFRQSSFSKMKTQMLGLQLLKNSE